MVVLVNTLTESPQSCLTNVQSPMEDLLTAQCLLQVGVTPLAPTHMHNIIREVFPIYDNHDIDPMSNPNIRRNNDHCVDSTNSSESHCDSFQRNNSGNNNDDSNSYSNITTNNNTDTNKSADDIIIYYEEIFHPVDLTSSFHGEPAWCVSDLCSFLCSNSCLYLIHVFLSLYL